MKHSLWQSLIALVMQRCPRCQRGRLFRGLITMNDPCPVCGLILQREEGYFLGAMYVSYTIGTILVGGGFFLAQWLFPQAGDFAVIGGVVFLYLLMTPAVFRYARAIWIYFDRWGCLEDTSAGPYEKARVLELTESTCNSDRPASN
ncbi:MAG: DUF983 domain-containing protein [Gemmataceae bacterium]|nr:DUF983 domain-containing protein [Gemmataceae bacterium]